MTNLPPTRLLHDRILLAALDFCKEEAVLREHRKAFSKLKYDHNGETICMVDYHRGTDGFELCEACVEYESRINHKGSLRYRQRAKRQMMTAYSRLNSQGAQHSEPASKTDNGGSERTSNA